jgi:DNA-binding XRE family transcriptional regulator
MRRTADRAAGATALVVLALGGLVVVKPAVDHWDTLYRGDPFDGGQESPIERVLGSSGVLALRLILVVIAAYLAAALVQRVLLADYRLRIGSDQSEQADDTGSPPPAATSDNGQVEGGDGSLAPPIARLIATRRQQLGISQRELAKRAGLSHTVVSRMEQGEHTPSRKTLELLADALRAAR